MASMERCPFTHVYMAHTGLEAWCLDCSLFRTPLIAAGGMVRAVEDLVVVPDSLSDLEELEGLICTFKGLINLGSCPYLC